MTETPLTVKEAFWSRFAERFEADTEYIAGRETIEAIADAISRQRALGRVLELACGNGTYTFALARSATAVVATDLSDEMLAVAKRKLAPVDNVSFDKIDCHNIPYENGSFDTVFMANLIHVISDPMRVIDESARVIKPGGRLIITSFTAEGMNIANKVCMIVKYLKRWGKPPEDARSFKLAELSGLLTALSFIITDAGLLGNRTKALFVVAEKPLHG